jgi:cell wall-associated NlpC family hydrolase
MSSSVPTGVREFTLCLLAVMLLAACGHEPVRRTNTGAPVMQPVIEGEQAAIVALGQVGVPYRYGGANSRGFDCSGLVQYAWSHAGARIPRTTGAQWRELMPVQDRELKPGDVLFFRIDGSISHVGLYVGEGRFVHAPATGREVAVASLSSDFYRRSFIRGGRPD